MTNNPRVDAVLLQFHPLRHVLTNVVGSRSRLDVHVVEEPQALGDLLLLTTDGVHGALDDHRLAGLLTGVRDLAEAPADIVHAAIARGSRENCTAVVALYSAD